MEDASADPNASRLIKADFEGSKQQIDRIHTQGSKFRNELEKSRLLIIENLQLEYNALLNANNSVGSILQSAVDVEQAKNEGLLTVSTLSKSKMNLTDINNEVSKYLSKIGSASDNAVGLYDAVQTLFNQPADV